MKTAIVCDWLAMPGGAEKALGEMLTCFPEADLFAVVDFLPENHRAFLGKKRVKTTFIQKLPFAKKYYRHYLPLMPIAIEQLDLSPYDFILSSSHAVAKGVITGPDQLHICYIHSPMRYAWDLQHQYLRETGLDKKWLGLLARYFLHRLRQWDVRSAHGVDYFIANSNYIARRVLKTYRRKADVIYPGVELQRFTPHYQKEDFYLTASRLVPYKRIDLIVETFAMMPDKKLIVIGSGPELNKIKSKATANVNVMGYQPDDILIKMMQRAKAFIFAAEEDFGLIPLEAQSCGTPVIAYGKGGAKETVRSKENPTGLFFNEQTVQSLKAAILQFESTQHLFTVENCVQHASSFSLDQFRKNLIHYVHDKMNVS